MAQRISNEPPLASDRGCEATEVLIEHNTKISLFIHTLISEETESFYSTNHRLKMNDKVNVINNNRSYTSVQTRDFRDKTSF